MPYQSTTQLKTTTRGR